MTASLRVRRSIQQLRMFLLWAAAGLVVLGVLIGAFADGHPWSSVGLGVAAGLVMFAVSIFTMTRAVQSDVPHIGWISLDYVTKIAITGGVIFWARSAEQLDVVVVAILVIAAIVAGTVAQVAAFLKPVRSGGPGAEPSSDDEGGLLR